MVVSQDALGADESVKGFQVEAADGAAGTVEWANYAPGESYLVVTRRHGLRKQHYVVPAGAVEQIDTGGRTVRLRLTQDEIDALPEHYGQPAPLETWMAEAVERAVGMRGLGGDMV